METPFLKKFGKYHPGGEQLDIIDKCTAYEVKVSKESRLIVIDMTFSSVIPMKSLFVIEDEIREAYDVNGVTIHPRYDSSLFDEKCIDDIMLELNRTAAVSRGFFRNYSYRIEGNKLTVDTASSNGGIDLIYSAQTHQVLSDIIFREYGLRFDVTIRKTDNYAYDYDEAQAAAISTYMSENAVKTVLPDENEEKKPDAKYITSFYGEEDIEAIKNGDGSYTVGNMTFDVSEPVSLYGEPFEIEPTPMRNLRSYMRFVCVTGELLYVDFKDTRKGDKTIINFALSDDDGSVFCKMIAPKEEADGILKAITKKEAAAPNTFLAVCGSLKPDKFDGELCISPAGIQKIKRIQKADKSEKKRVELHLHTNMSAMDALIPPAEAVRTANRWGMPAVAITDHGNVQGYQDAMLASEDLGQKVIYGIEAYFVDDAAKCVYGEKDVQFDGGEFVVFDIETTGLSPLNDAITEIGAALVRNGEVISVFNTFADPGRHIPENITELTGITDEMVAGAPSQLEAVKSFLEYAGDRILIAHNAGFDTSFIRKVCDDNGIEFKSTYIDTVALSKYVNPTLKKHKLDTIAAFYRLGDFNHHRASDDAEMLAAIFFKMTEKLVEEGIKSVGQMQSSMADKVDVLKMKTYHMIILVKNKVGLKNLYKLVSFSYLNYFKKHPRIPKSVLDNYREGLIIGSACSEGELFSAMLENRPHSELVEMASYYDYIEIQPICNNRYLIAQGSANNDEDLRNFNRKLIAIADEAGRPVCATCDVHFLEKHDEIYRKILLAGMKFSDADKDTGIYFRTTEEMLKEFDYLGDRAEEVVITNTNKIADMVESGIRPFPKGTFTPHIDGAEEDLQRICYEHAENQYGSPLPELVKTRLDKELNSIISNGYAVLYIIAQKLVSFSESQGYLVGSRGSVGSSFVASCAGISEVNPLPPHYYCPKCRYSDFSNPDKVGSGFDLPDANCPRCGEKMRGDGHNIPFETFLGFKGDKSPDIDLNFSGDVQGRVHKYTEELFGAENVFRAGTIGALADKTVFGYVMKYLEERKIKVNQAEIQRIEKHCIGVKRTTGQHPGGIVVVPKEMEIYDFCPVQHPAEDPDSNIVTTHFTFEYLHDTLLKLDELGHDMPTKYKWLEKYSGTSVMDVPMNAPEVYELFTSTEPLGIKKGDIDANIGTYGLPELGTRFVMKMVEEAKPKTFADLLQISGLSHGTDVWTGNAQDLINNGTCTISQVIGCRDNIMNDLIRYGVPNKMSFDIMESVRKGKGLKPEMVEAMNAANVPEWYMDSCRKIKYMFPKAHAAAYVMSAIRLGWYKVHMPLVFYAAFFSAAPGGFDAEIALSGKAGVVRTIREIQEKGNEATQKETGMIPTLNLINECYARKIGFLPIDFEKSEAFAYVPENGKIRLPFNSLAGVGDTAAQAIVDARNTGGILSIEDLRFKARLTKSVVDILKANGALDCLSETNQITFF